ncbi:hypothetical protein KEM48_011999 [Puccinia striiformis f. sp. tritici PST-130]|nr:hypothetical protein KEM48_011999 [Puccinia striiformis f. sp. tritici PST-130]
MADPTQKVVSFVLSLPPSTNPFEAVAVKIGEQTQILVLPLWARILRRIITIQFCILCGQCLTVLWLRKKGNKLTFFRINQLGLIHVEVLNEIVLFMYLFSLVAVIDLATQELVELGLMKLSSKLVLRTSKFAITADVCCFCHLYMVLFQHPVFLWICGIETAMAFTSLRARARAGSSIKLSPWVRYTANGMLLAVLTLPSAFILWASIRIALDVKAIEMASEKIMAGLLEAAPTYRPETYNLMQILEILKPGQGFAIRTNHLAHDAKLILLLYLVLQLTGAALYVPTSMLAFRGLRKQTASGSAQKKKKEAREAPMSQHQTPMTKLMNDGPGQEKAALESVRRRLVKHAWLLYLDTILYCPILVYMVSILFEATFLQQNIFLSRSDLDGSGTSGDACAYRHYWECVSGETVK